MSGSTSPFGQSSNSPSESSVFAQINSASNNPFAPIPFWSPNPSGSQSGDSILGGTSNGLFGAPQAPTPTFGSSSSSFSFGSSPALGQSTSVIGIGSTLSPSPFGAQSSAIGSQTTTPTYGTTTFGQSSFGGQQRGGIRVAAYSCCGTQAAGKLESISAMPVYKDKTHEELRWEDYQFGDKGQSSSGGQQRGGSRVATYTPTPEQYGACGSQAAGKPISAMPVCKNKSHEELRWENYQFGDKGKSSFGGQQCGGSRVATYTPTAEQYWGCGTQAAGKLESISAMPVYKNKSHEELRWEDHQFGDKGQSSFGGQQRGGSSVTAYTPTAEQYWGCGTQAAGKLESISAMPVYKNKSHEELRWEDYQLGDKGVPNPAGQSAAAGSGVGASAPSVFGQTTSTQPAQTGDSLCGNFGQTQQTPAPTGGFAGGSSLFGLGAFGQSCLPFLCFRHLLSNLRKLFD